MNSRRIDVLLQRQAAGTASLAAGANARVGFYVRLLVRQAAAGTTAAGKAEEANVRMVCHYH